MKLERNNKYSGKKLLNSLKIILLSSTLLMGCSKVNAEEIAKTPVVNEAPVITDMPIITPTPTLTITNNNFWKISDEEIDKEISEMIIKNPDKIHNMDYVQTVVTKDKTGDYEVMTVFTGIADKNLEVYDIFTEEYLFTLKNFKKFVFLENSFYFDIDLNSIVEKSSYFDDKQIVAMGNTFATIYFVSDYFEEVKEQIGMTLNYLPDSYYNSIYDKEVYSNQLNFTVSEIAKQYVKIIPKELRVLTNLLDEKSEKQYNDVKATFSYYWKISDEEREKRLEEYDIKYPDSIWIMNQIETIVLKDANDNYKVLQVIIAVDQDKNVICFYDLFTEEKLFDLPLKDKEFNTNTTGKYIGFDLNQIYNKIPYFEDKKIIEYGTCTYSTSFVQNHLEELRKKDGIEYFAVDGNPCTYMYPIKFNVNDISYTKRKISENYVTTVPNQFRVTPKEMGLTITYKKEREYADYWKISDEEQQRRMDEIYLSNKDDQYKVRDVKTLIVSDKNRNEKILNATLKYKDGYIYFYDLYTETYLFKTIGNNNTDISTLDFSYIEEEIPYFEDKKISKTGEFYETYAYICNNIDKYRKRDGINYELPDDGGIFYIKKYGKFSEDSSYTIEQYATCYVTIVREENQVSQSELMIGLDKNKVLVKQ